MKTADLLRERNDRFVESKFRAGLTLRPAVPALVITCLDPRVDPAHVLGLELGDAPVIRNIGGRVTPGVLAQLQLLGLLTGATVEPAERLDLILMQHDDCGITRMTSDGPGLASYLGLAKSAVDVQEVSDPTASVRRDLARLEAIDALRARFHFVGLVYGVTTGRVRIVGDVDPTDGTEVAGGDPVEGGR